MKKTATFTKRYPVEMIEWKDHHANDKGWVAPDKIEHKPELCLSLGWLVKEDEEGITLVSCIDPIDEEGTLGGLQYILKNCITRRKVLKK